MRKPIGKISNPKQESRMRRRLSIRKKVNGTASRPRVNIFKSNKHLRVQVIDDNEGKTLVTVQTYGKTAVAGAKANKDGAKLVGEKVAEGLKAKNITEVVFDRAGYKYTGVIANVADAIRENGIQL